MIEKIYTPQFGEFDTKQAVVEAHDKINELVDEVEELRLLINGLLGAVAAIIKSSSSDPPE